MLQLNQITKYYQSKKNKNKVLALDKVSLSFQEKGLVFILGPSGCGKSTLLNLIGGIDYPTEGEILFHQIPIGAKEKELEDYRNQYVGFVFQDYNLIQNITVFDNLSLACFTMTQEEKIERIQKVLRQVGLEGYEQRYPTELSGGQMQRIAIARAMLKNSEMLLADEPTGNLNSEMSIEIMELLRQIASEKLVIVVSHNEEIANHYAQRIIRLKDGKVISDSNPRKMQEEKVEKETKKTAKKQLSFSIILKMIGSNLLSKKTDTILSTFVLFLAFISLFFSIGFVDYNRMDVDYQNISTMKEDYIFTGYGKERNTKSSQMNELIKKHPDLVYTQNNYIQSSKDLIKMGYEFYPGYQELTKEGIYISDRYLKYCFDIDNYTIFWDSEGKNIVELESEIDFTKLVGTYFKEPVEYEFSVYKYFRIDGIFKSLNENYANIISTDLSSLEQDTLSYYNNIQKDLYYQRDGGFANSCIRVRDTIYKKDNFTIKFNDKKTDFIGMNYYGSNGTLTICNKVTQYRHYNVILNADSYIYLDSVYGEECNFKVENENEIYLSLYLYNQVFKEFNSQQYYIKQDSYNSTFEVIHYPKHIGEELSFELIDNFFPDYRFKKEKLVFKGLLFSTFYFEPDKPLSSHEHLILMSDSNYKKYIELTDDITISIKKDSISNLGKLIKDCNKLDIDVEYVQSNYIDDFETAFETTMSIFSILFVLLSIMTFFMNYGFVKRTIKRRSKEIGILRSIGVKKGDILKIYLYQVLVIAILLIIVTIPCSYFSIWGINKLLVYNYDTSLYLLFYKWWYIPMTILCIFGISYLSASFTLIPLGKRRAIDIIKNE